MLSTWSNKIARCFTLASSLATTARIRIDNRKAKMTGGTILEGKDFFNAFSELGNNLNITIGVDAKVLIVVAFIAKFNIQFYAIIIIFCNYVHTLNTIPWTTAISCRKMDGQSMVLVRSSLPPEEIVLLNFYYYYHY